MANNNFFLNNDPLLYQSNYRSIDDNPINAIANQYNKLIQQQSQPTYQQYDYVGELDRLIKNVNPNAIAELSTNEEYQRLNGELGALIQNELMASIKWKINDNPDAIRNIKRQTELINGSTKKLEEEQRQNLNDLNDYVKNYSNITFDEYKKIKNDTNNKK